MSADDSRVAGILGEWQERLDGGEDIDPERVIAEHPELAAELREQFAALSQLRQAHDAKPLPTRLRTLPVDRYGEFKPAGEGGMGIVYWAIDTDLNREVAFKVIRPGAGSGASPLELASPAKDTPASQAFETLKQRFLQEAWVTGGLSHPGIVPVYELGETPEGVPYYTMRFIKGERTLATAIDQAQGQNVEQRLRLLEPFLKVCDTLSYAHAQGVIHRDLKPDNIALGEFGEVVVIDWGLAKIQDRPDVAHERWQDRIQEYREATDLRTVASAMGTPGYMAPEAAKGQADRMNARSDVYSLGAILFQILTGRLPFEFTTFGELMMKVLQEDPPTAVDVADGIPEALSQLCARCLARELDARPADAKELGEAIRTWQAEREREREIEGFLREAEAALASAEGLRGADMLRQVDRATAAVSQVRKRRPESARARQHQARADALRETGIRERERGVRKQVLVRGGIAALVVAVVVGAVGSIVFRRQRDEADAARAREAVQRERADQEAGAARSNLARAYAHLATTLLRDGRAGEARVAAAKAAAMEPTLEGSGAIGTLSTVWSPTVRPLVPGTSAFPIAVAPEGRLFYSGGTWDGSIRIWDLEEDRALGFLRGHEDTVLALAPSPDGQVLYSGGTGGEIHVWSVASRSLTGKLPTRGVAITALVVSASGDRLWSGCEDGSVHGWDPTGDRHVVTIETGTSPVALIRTASAAQRVLVWTADRTSRVYDARSGELVAASEDSPPAFLSPDGTQLLSSSPGSSRCRRLDLASGQEEILQIGSRSPRSVALALTADGRRVLFPWDSFWWERIPGQVRRVGLPGHVQALAITPYGTTAYASLFDRSSSSSNGSRAALLITGAVPTSGDPIDVTEVRAHYDAHPGDVQALAITADGAHVVSAGDDGAVIWWDLASGLPARWKKATRETRSMSFLLNKGGTTLVTGSNAGEIRVADLDGEEDEWAFQAHDTTVSALALSEDQALLAMGGWAGAVRVWSLDRRDETPLQVFEAPGGSGSGLGANVSAVTFDAAGKRLYSGTWAGRIRVWDVETGDAIRSFEGHVGMVTDLAVSRDGKRLFSASNDFTVRIWNLETDEDPLVLKGHGGTYGATCVLESPDGRVLYSGGNDGTVRRWDAHTGTSFGVLTSHRDAVYALALPPDGGRLYSGGGMGAASDLMGDCLVREWHVDTRATEDYVGVVRCRTFALAKNGRHAVLWPSGDPLTLATFDFRTGALREVPELKVEGHGGGIAALSPSGDRVYFVDTSGAITAWNLTPDPAERRYELERPSAETTALHVAPAGDRVIAGHADGSVSVWDAETRRKILDLTGGSAAITAVALGPLGKHVYAGGVDAQLHVWDVQSGELLKSYEAAEREELGINVGGSGVEDIVLSQDGRRLYAAAGEVFVVDLEKDGQLDPIRIRGCWIQRVALGPEGRLLFATGTANTYLVPAPNGEEDATPIFVWDVEAGDVEAVLHGHSGPVDFLAASTDGRRVISSSWDRTTRVWDVPWATASPQARLRQAEERYGHVIRGFGTVPLGVNDLIERRPGTFGRRLPLTPHSDRPGGAGRER